MELPKLYRPIIIRFPSLRNGVGDNLGVIFDIDTFVDREVMRVIRKGGGWKWQIKGINDLKYYDYFVEIDQEILNEIGENLDDIEYAE